LARAAAERAVAFVLDKIMHTPADIRASHLARVVALLGGIADRC
jgi:hypothetical protein